MSTRLRVGLACAAVGFALVMSTAQAATTFYDFNSAPPPDLNFVGGPGWTDPITGEVILTPAWRATGGVNDSGYIALFDSVDSQHASVLLPDFEPGLVVKAFIFECDLRVGNATGEGGRPADGFSISYASADDPVVVDLVQEPPVDNINNFSLAGAPENGTRTGLAISFDTWAGNTQPDGGVDIEGIMINVNQVVTMINGQRGIPMATRNGACDDATSMQTGPWSGGLEGAGPSDVSGLCWAHLKVEVDDNSALTVTWKGTVIADHVPTGFAPTAGRIVLAGRTGGANENTHLDNLSITTTPADKVVIGAPNGTPTGFTITVSDSGPSVFDATVAGAIVDFQLNGSPKTVTRSSKTGTTTTLYFSDAAAPIAPGSANTTILTVKDTRGITETKTGAFTGIAYATLLPAWATTSAATPGFTLKMYQVDHVDDLGVSHASDVANNGVSIAGGERMLHGDLGPNTADLTLFTGTGGTYVAPSVINFNAAAGNAGFYVDDGTVPPGVASPNVPGLPGTAPREGGNDDCAMQLISYVEFPTAGAYQMIFNSDDGFRMTAFANPLEVLNAPIVAQFDNGRGASDTMGWVYVSTPGIYGFRTIWMQGGGGANLEFAAINEAGIRALVNDVATTGALRAFAVNNGAVPAAVTFADPPRGSGRQVPALYPVTFEITDGATAVTGITLTINGTAVTPTITKVGSVSKVVYNDLLPQNQTVTAVIGFTDGTATYSGTNSFSVGGGAVVPPSMALNAADVNRSNPGFLIKTFQVGVTNNGAGANGVPNDTQMAEALVRNLWGWPNRANLTAFTGPGGSYVETTAINYNGGAPNANVPPDALNGGNAGTFVDDGTLPPNVAAPNMPGIVFNDQLQEYGIDNYVLEIRTVLDLQPGIYFMGVNSDDGFRVIVGDGKEAYTLPVVCGEFSAGRGTDNWGFTQFGVKITQAGLYPFRLVFEEGGGGNSVEWFQIVRHWQPDQIGKALINDPAITTAMKAYQYPISSTGPTYVKSIAPGRSSLDSVASSGRAGPDATVKLVLVDGSTPVNTANVSMAIDGAAVTPTVNKVGTETTVSYKPATEFTMGNSYNVAVTFGDRTVSWTFKVGLPATPVFWIEAADYDYDGGQSKPEASIMPYAGGAYAGLAGVAGTDYKGPFDSDNPYYRYPNTQRVPMSWANDRDRGGGEVIVNYRIGWMGSGQWFNYTRTFPAGRYNVYAALSVDGARIFGNLEDVTGGGSTILGSFNAAFNSAGGGTWGNNNLVPLKDVATTNDIVTLDLSGTKTLRYNDGNGDWDFMLLLPAGTARPEFSSVVKNTDGTITATWTGGGTLQAATVVTGPYVDVPGAASPYTFTPTAPAMFSRIRQ